LRRSCGRSALRSLRRRSKGLRLSCRLRLLSEATIDDGTRKGGF